MNPDTEPMSIGRRLAEEAAVRGISHEAAAEIIGVSQATFTRWANDDNPPGPSYWTAVGRFLKIPKAEVAQAIALERSARSTRGQAGRLDELERQVREMRGELATLTQLVKRATGRPR